MIKVAFIGSTGKPNHEKVVRTVLEKHFVAVDLVVGHHNDILCGNHDEAEEIAFGCAGIARLFYNKPDLSLSVGQVKNGRGFEYVVVARDQHGAFSESRGEINKALREALEQLFAQKKVLVWEQTDNLTGRFVRRLRRLKILR